MQEFDAPVYDTRLTRGLIEIKLRGAPDMTADPEIQERKEILKAEAVQIIDGMLGLGVDAPGDPLLDVEVLARSVEIVLLDAPNLRSSPHACGQMRTRAVEGAIVAVDESGHPLEERERIASVMGLIFVVLCTLVG